MQPYNQGPSYEQNSIGGNINPDGNNLETTINSLNKNQRGSIGKKLLIAGGVMAIVAGSIVYALNPFSQEIYPSPTPTNMPVAASPIPTLLPTETPKPAEIPLEERLPDYGPLSASEIRGYVRTALEISSKLHNTNDSKERGRLWEEGREWMRRAAYAVVVSSGEDYCEKHTALRMTLAEWMFGGLIPEWVVTEIQDQCTDVKGHWDISSLRFWMIKGLEPLLGMPYGFEKK